MATKKEIRNQSEEIFMLEMIKIGMKQIKENKRKGRLTREEIEHKNALIITNKLIVREVKLKKEECI